MARAPRLEIVNGVYHVTQHATGAEVLFVDAFDRYFFERVLDRCIRRYRWRLDAYCQVGNHYHLLIRLSEPSLARGMQFLNGRYAQAFNERHGRRGTLVRGRYTSTIVETSSHYVHSVLYIAMNPVKAGLCQRPGEWEWGSYGGNGPLSRPPDELLRGFIDVALA